MKTMQYLKNVVTLMLDANLCIGCGLCVMVCPHAVFEINNRKARIIDFDDCMECGACARNCQFGAISVAPNLQFLAHAPLSMQSSKSIIRAFRLLISKTAWGQTMTHNPHPIQRLASSINVTTFLRYCIVFISN